MFAKLILVVFSLIILKPALSAEIMSRLEIDDSQTSVLESSPETDSNSEDEESTTITILIPTIVGDGETVDGMAEDNPAESNEEFTSNSRTSSENSDGFVLFPMSLRDDLRVNLAHTRDPETPGMGNLQLSIFTSNGNGFQVFDGVDRRRRGNNHGDSHLIDPHMPPQMQLVDNTLRLVAIKSSVDDLATRLFPNLHVVRRSLQERK